MQVVWYLSTGAGPEMNGKGSMPILVPGPVEMRPQSALLYQTLLCCC